MEFLEQTLNEMGVDWGKNKETGLCFISSNDYNDDLLTDVSGKCKYPMNSLDYGQFVVIAPNDEIKSAAEIMKKFGYKLQPRASDQPINDVPKSRQNRDMIQGGFPLNNIIHEVAEDLNTEQLFAQFGRAMKVLGEQMGIGPLQTMLKKRGINWRMGDDNSSIVFYIKNNVTGESQPVARISSESIGSQHEFQEQLYNMMDFASGKAPGSFKQRREQIQKHEQLVRDISKAVWPTDKSSHVANLMMQ